MIDCDKNALQAELEPYYFKPKIVRLIEAAEEYGFTNTQLRKMSIRQVKKLLTKKGYL